MAQVTEATVDHHIKRSRQAITLQETLLLLENRAIIATATRPGVEISHEVEPDQIARPGYLENEMMPAHRWCNRSDHSLLTL
jgi:hypothetical protein